jgi:Protein of unknown function (DUF3054)
VTVQTTRPATAAVVGAAVVDVLALLVFAAIGRDSHAERIDVLGVLAVAAPFLAGALVGWLVGRVWREPLGLRLGAVVWAGAVVVGLGLRAAVLHRLPVSFVLVASVSLAVFLLGWRLIGWLGARLRGRGA